MLSALSAKRADFLIVGAHAVAAHGSPRATGDLDIWVRPEPSNAQRVFAALTEFGAPLFDLSLEDLSTPGVVFQIGVAPQRIDILTKISGVEFEEAWRDRVELEIEGRRLPFIGRAQLIQNKRAAGRYKDLGDIEALEGQGSED
ncbi:MAG: hypothetical protein IT384_00835 [Deltaproteobacteria bacterium]|nr:hypothetical protein [Deltaproteobacteria bacterium]